MDTILTDRTYVANTYARFNLNLVRGKGSLLFDDKGNEYIDLATGIAVNTFGVCDEEWKSAVIAQLNTLTHTSNLYYTEPCANLAKVLCQRTGLKKVFFSNSGAEANECAIKTARKYSEDKYGKGRHTIITLKNSFHGRTITTLSATGQDVFHTTFNPLTEGFRYATANDINSVKAELKGDVCAIMLEVVQGEGGVLPLNADFLQGVYALCQQNDVLLICDEVQTGNGRTGKLYAYQNFDIMPDVVSTAKGLAGGLPMGATLLGEKVANTLTPSSHGSTFGGNPVCAAGALNVLGRIDDDLLLSVQQKSEYIIKELSCANGVKSVSGLGLMLGVETEKDATEVVAKAMEKGVLVIKAKNKVRLLPALNIDFNLLKKAIEILKTVL